jgi:hypothetical protein
MITIEILHANLFPLCAFSISIIRLSLPLLRCTTAIIVIINLNDCTHRISQGARRVAKQHVLKRIIIVVLCLRGLALERMLRAHL